MNRKESKAARRAAKRAAKLASLTPEQQAKRAAKKAAKAERRAKKKEAKARALAGLGGAVVTAAAGTSFGQEVAGTFGLDTAGIGGRASDLLLGLQGFGGSSAATPGFGPSLPPLPSEAPPEGGGIMDWIKANPIMAAGGAVVLLFVARKLF